MRPRRMILMMVLPLLVITFPALPASAAINVQCPGDTDGDAVWTAPEAQPGNTVCIHLAAGDGFVTMADGKLQYMFGFSDVTGTPPHMVMDRGMLAANFAAPTIKVKEGQNVYLSLSNVGMIIRPDLFDPHTVHWHGFPNAASIFDGEPMASISVNMNATLTYYYQAPDPGTYMYHCHVEATEHMQMGMLGNLYVTAAQDDLPNGTPLNHNGSTFVHTTGNKYVYNDGDGSTYYDVDFPIQIHAFDSNFHDLHLDVQPLPFAMMKDNYPMLNGRGYPDTVNPNPLTPPMENMEKVSQAVSSLVTTNADRKVLLRISSLSTIDFFTLTVLGIPMKVVGKDAKLLRSSTGQNLYYTTNSVTLGGGESADVILDTTGVAPGTYFLYTTNLNNLSNNTEDYGGMMTEIVIN